MKVKFSFKICSIGWNPNAKYMALDPIDYWPLLETLHLPMSSNPTGLLGISSRCKTASRKFLKKKNINYKQNELTC